MKSKIALVLAVLAILLAGALSLSRQAPGVAAGAAAPPATGTAPAGPRWLDNTPQWTPGAAAVAPAREPLARQLQRLAASGDPEDSYKAYWLINDCMFVQSVGDLPPSAPPRPDSTPAERREAQAFCSELTERMRMARMDYLRKAAEAGVACADMQQLDAGPFGDPSALETRPDDPLVKEWRTRTEALILAHADEGRFCTLSLLPIYAIRHDAPLSLDAAQMLAYGWALREFHEGMHHDPASWSLASEVDLQPYIDKLTPVQVAEAKARARRIAALAIERARATAERH